MQTPHVGMMPADDMKSVKDNPINGIYANADKSYPFTLKYLYKTVISKPNAEPNTEMMFNFRRPRVSARNADIKAPQQSATPDKIIDMYGSTDCPTLANVMTE